MLGQASNPMLAQAEKGIESKVSPKLKPAFDKVVQAGLTIMYSPKLQTEMKKNLASTTDFADAAGKGASRLISNLYMQSNKAKQVQDVAVPACMIFAFEYLDLAEKSGKVQVTPELISKATQAVSDAVLPMFGMTQDKIQSLMQQRQQGQQPQQPKGIISGAMQGA